MSAPIPPPAKILPDGWTLAYPVLVTLVFPGFTPPGNQGSQRLTEMYFYASPEAAKEAEDRFHKAASDLAMDPRLVKIILAFEDGLVFAGEFHLPDHAPTHLAELIGSASVVECL